MDRHHPGRRLTRAVVFVAPALVLLLAVTPAARAAQGPDPAALGQLALDLVNKARAERGLSRLDLGPEIDQAAKRHAQDMLRRHYYSHTSPEGGTVLDRYVAAGGSRWRLVAENIARCEGCRPPVTPDTVRELQEGWMNSPHHRENILHKGLDRFGFALVVDAQNGMYAVQTFAGPGEPRGATSETAAALPAEEVPARFARLVNQARKDAGVAALQPNPALNQLAQTLLPDPGKASVSLDAKGNLFDALPPGQRTKWRQLQVISAACGGCGARPSEADLRYFTQQWLDDSQYKDKLLDPSATGIGVAVQSDGAGRKTALLVLGSAR